MEIHVHLYSVLRDKLPPDQKGKTTIQLKEGATLANLLQEFDINRRVAISVNGVQERDYSRQLADQDLVKIFTSVGGG